jgi:uncharacterized membrane protein YcaP (DUF421 family)
MSILVKDGIADMQVLSAIGISRSELFAQLRGQAVTHLGVVERFYMEANGTFTLIKYEEPTSGLLVLPETDPDFIGEFEKDPALNVCANCGHRQSSLQATAAECPNCRHQEWTPAVCEKKVN